MHFVERKRPNRWLFPFSSIEVNLQQFVIIKCVMQRQSFHQFDQNTIALHTHGTTTNYLSVSKVSMENVKFTYSATDKKIVRRKFFVFNKNCTRDSN